MGEATKIQWTDHTFNAWWGCTRVSPGCDNCYAEAFDHRLGGKHWGVGAPRRTFGDKHWAEPLKWNAQAANEGRPHRVFCSSMADVFDREAPPGELERLWRLIWATPNLDWQLLTKRAERIKLSLPATWGDRGWPNVWLGVTVEDQKRARLRIPDLVDVPARVRFLSCEPLLEEVRLGEWLGGLRLINWVIVGGESGPRARLFDASYARAIAEECRAAGVACFVKQLGDFAIDPDNNGLTPLRLKPKGGDPNEWSEDLRVREFPR